MKSIVSKSARANWRSALINPFGVNAGGNYSLSAELRLRYLREELLDLAIERRLSERRIGRLESELRTRRLHTWERNELEQRIAREKLRQEERSATHDALRAAADQL